MFGPAAHSNDAANESREEGQTSNELSAASRDMGLIDADRGSSLSDERLQTLLKLGLIAPSNEEAHREYSKFESESSELVRRGTTLHSRIAIAELELPRLRVESTSVVGFVAKMFGTDAAIARDRKIAEYEAVLDEGVAKYIEIKSTLDGLLRESPAKTFRVMAKFYQVTEEGRKYLTHQHSLPGLGDDLEESVEVTGAQEAEPGNIQLPDVEDFDVAAYGDDAKAGEHEVDIEDVNSTNEEALASAEALLRNDDMIARGRLRKIFDQASYSEAERIIELAAKAQTTAGTKFLEYVLEQKNLDSILVLGAINGLSINPGPKSALKFIEQLYAQERDPRVVNRIFDVLLVADSAALVIDNAVKLYVACRSVGYGEDASYPNQQRIVKYISQFSEKEATQALIDLFIEDKSSDTIEIEGELTAALCERVASQDVRQVLIRYYGELNSIKDRLHLVETLGRLPEITGSDLMKCYRAEEDEVVQARLLKVMAERKMFASIWTLIVDQSYGGDYLFDDVDYALIAEIACVGTCDEEKAKLLKIVHDETQSPLIEDRIRAYFKSQPKNAITANIELNAK